MDCGTSLAKYILFIFNTLVTILGILAVIYGVLIFNHIQAIGEVDAQGDFLAQIIFSICLIALGAVAVFISFFGCCGAIREDVCLTMCYAVFMLILLILQLVLIVFLFVNKDQITKGLDNVIDRVWASESKQPGAFEVIQRTLSCCGSNGFTDYGFALKLPPSSCCPAGEVCSPLNYYGGCKQKIHEYMNGSSEQVKYFGIGLIVVELVGFVFACCVANNVRNYKRRNAY